MSELFNLNNITSLAYHFLHLLTRIYQQCYFEQQISYKVVEGWGRFPYVYRYLA